MVTREQIFEYTGRKPFEPFRVVLHNGENAYVIRRFQATANNREMFIGANADDERSRYILLKDIERLELTQPQQH